MSDTNTLLLAALMVLVNANNILNAADSFLSRFRKIPRAIDKMADDIVDGRERKEQLAQLVAFGPQLEAIVALKPQLTELVALTPDLSRIVEQTDAIVAAFKPNGEDVVLPPDLQGRSTRALVVECVAQLQSREQILTKLVSVQEEHSAMLADLVEHMPIDADGGRPRAAE